VAASDDVEIGISAGCSPEVAVPGERLHLFVRVSVKATPMFDVIGEDGVPIIFQEIMKESGSDPLDFESIIEVDERFVPGEFTIAISIGAIFAKAVLYFEVIEQVVVERMDLFNQALNRRSQSAMAWAENRKSEVVDLLAETATLYERAGAPQAQASVLSDLGSLFASRGEARRAIDAFELAVRLFRSVGDSKAVAMCYEDLAKVYAEIGERRSDLYPVTVGIGVYPDSMVLPVGVKAGFFESVGLDVKVRYLGWQRQIFDMLVSRDVAVILANKSVTESRNRSGRYFHYYTDLNIYFGFAIMVHRWGSFKSYRDMRESGNGARDNDEIVRAVLQQLKGAKVIASRETDHASALVRCAELAGLRADVDYEIIGNLDPYDGLALFLSQTGRGNMKMAYVGGISQRLMALRAGKMELIAQDQVNLGLSERNGLVTLATNPPVNSEIVARLEHGWFRTVEAIDHERENRNYSEQKLLSELVASFNAHVPLKDSRGHLTLDDVALFWDKWEKIPASEEEASKVASVVELTTRRRR
jgi:hypothetical protein